MKYGIDPPPSGDEWALKLWFNSIFNFVESKTKNVSVSADYTPLSKDFCVWVDATAGVKNFTVPLASSYPGRTIAVIKSDSSSNAVNVNRSGSDTLANLTTFPLGTQYHSALLHSNGNATWAILARFPNVVA